MLADAYRLCNTKYLVIDTQSSSRVLGLWALLIIIDCLVLSRKQIWRHVYFLGMAIGFWSEKKERLVFFIIIDSYYYCLFACLTAFIYQFLSYYFSLIPYQNIIDGDVYQLDEESNKAHNSKTD